VLIYDQVFSCSMRINDEPLTPYARKCGTGEEVTKTAIVIAAIILGVSACGGGNSVSGDPPTAACAMTAPPRLVSPAAGAIGVATSFNMVVSYDPGTAYARPVLTATSSAAVMGGPWTAAVNSEGASAVANLAAATTYSVTVTNAMCGNTFTIGSFTTL